MMRNGCDIYGASVRGPLHISSRAPNQDAWRGGQLAAASYITVCDGLGSCKHAKEGARLACAAVHKAVSSDRCHKPLSGQELAQQIHSNWMSSIGSLDARDFATTCLFATREESGRVIAGGIGDGMALVALRGGRVEAVVGSRNASFSNETHALTAQFDSRQWVLRDYPAKPPIKTVALVTDGISDDLRTDTLPEFLAWLDSEIAPLTPKKRWRLLAAELRNWPTANHLDDKTIAIMRVGTRPRRNR